MTSVFMVIIFRLIESFGWKGAMLMTAAIILIIILFGCLMRPLKPEESANNAKVHNRDNNFEALLCVQHFVAGDRRYLRRKGEVEFGEWK